MSFWTVDPTTGERTKVAGYDPYDDTAIRTQLVLKQNKTLENPIEGSSTVEGALAALSTKKATQDTLGYVKGGDGTSINANGGVDVVNRLEEISTLPTASVSNLGKCYLYLGNASGYQNGGIYQCQSDGAVTPTYSWALISANPFEAGKGITIEDNTINADTNVYPATSVSDWEALTSEEKEQYDYFTTPEEASEDIADEVTDGDMRPVTSNAVYDRLADTPSSNRKNFKIFGSLRACHISAGTKQTEAFYQIVDSHLIYNTNNNTAYVIGHYGPTPINSIKILNGIMTLLNGTTAVTTFAWNATSTIESACTMIGCAYDA
jgi:hypothetical protein